MDYNEIASHLTSAAIEAGLIKVKDFKVFDGDDPIEAANQYAAKQVASFYKTIRKSLNEN